MKTKASGWLWSWALALESASKNKSAAWKFMDWATSKQYIAYDASQERLGVRPAGHPHLDLPEPEVPGGREGLRPADAEGRSTRST